MHLMHLKLNLWGCTVERGTLKVNESSHFIPALLLHPPPPPFLSCSFVRPARISDPLQKELSNWSLFNWGLVQKIQPSVCGGPLWSVSRWTLCTGHQCFLLAKKNGCPILLHHIAVALQDFFFSEGEINPDPGSNMEEEGGVRGGGEAGRAYKWSIIWSALFITI